MSGGARRRSAAVLACAALALGGCAQRSYLVLLENADGSTGKVVVDSTDGRRWVERPGEGVSLGTSPRPITADAARVEADFGPALRALPPPPAVFLLYFESAVSRLTAESRAKLPQVLSQVRARPAPDISIVGHTDTVGSDAENEALGLARARVVHAILQAAGIDARDVSVSSHGEHNLLVPTPDNTDEARNRRVEVTVR